MRLERERITTPDDDFLDLDWGRDDNDRLVVMCHGIVGSSRSSYITSLAASAMNSQWDVLAWNFRGCSGEPNLRPRLYHSGATEDLETVLWHLVGKYHYRTVALVGFSLGANLVLKFLGEKDDPLRRMVAAAVAVSAPCSLAGAAKKMEWVQNRLYTWNILHGLRSRIEEKYRQFPDLIDRSQLKTIRSIAEFDDCYTAPLHGYRDVVDYYAKCSSKRYLSSIRTPTLILNARDDPFLSDDCHPHEICAHSSVVWLELPAHGGHVGFPYWSRPVPCWRDARVLQFLGGMASARISHEPKDS